MVRKTIPLLLLGACIGDPPPPPQTAPSTTSASTTVTDGPLTTSTGTPPATSTGSSLDASGDVDSGPVDAGSESTSAGSTTTTSGVTTTTTTGDPVACHPLLVEVYYDPKGIEDQEQWVKLFNDCPDDIDLLGYSLGWGGADYTVGTLDLLGRLAAGACFIVGGPQSSSENANPQLDQAVDLAPDLEKSGRVADGIALFTGPAASITPLTVPVDAVIYGDSNDSGLLDDQGDTPPPDVPDAGDNRSIRRVALDAWIIEVDPMPGLCPPY